MAFLGPVGLFRYPYGVLVPHGWLVLVYGWPSGGLMAVLVSLWVSLFSRAVVFPVCVYSLCLLYGALWGGVRVGG